MPDTQTNNQPPGNTLDEKEFHQVKSSLVNHAGISYIDFRNSLQPKFGRVYTEIILCWLTLPTVMCCAGLLFRNYGTAASVIIAFIASILLGYCLAGLVNFFHEATHFNIAPGKSANDLLANLAIGIFIGQGIKNYRIVHWQHHLELGTPNDTERSYFESLGPRFFLISLSGISAISVFLNRNRFVVSKNAARQELAREKFTQLCLSLLFHTTLLFSLFWIGQYWLMGTWILATGSFYPFFNRLRQLLEHRSEHASAKTDYSKTPHGKLSRLFGNNLLDRTFGSAGFNKHLLHHLEPSVSYTRLNDLEAFLEETTIGPLLKHNRKTYPATFIKLYNR